LSIDTMHSPICPFNIGLTLCHVKEEMWSRLQVYL
jgi:hypothetical protein